jgi:hypothetical protein
MLRSMPGTYEALSRYWLIDWVDKWIILVQPITSAWPSPQLSMHSSVNGTHHVIRNMPMTQIYQWDKGKSLVSNFRSITLFWEEKVIKIIFCIVWSEDIKCVHYSHFVLRVVFPIIKLSALWTYFLQLFPLFTLLESW